MHTMIIILDVEGNGLTCKRAHPHRHTSHVLCLSTVGRSEHFPLILALSMTYVDGLTHLRSVFAYCPFLLSDLSLHENTQKYLVAIFEYNMKSTRFRSCELFISQWL